MLRMAFWPGLMVGVSSLTLSPATFGSEKVSPTGHGDGFEIVTCSADGTEDLSCTVDLSATSERGFAILAGMGGCARAIPGAPPVGRPMPGGPTRPNGVAGMSCCGSTKKHHLPFSNFQRL